MGSTRRARLGVAILATAWLLAACSPPAGPLVVTPPGGIGLDPAQIKANQALKISLTGKVSGPAGIIAGGGGNIIAGGGGNIIAGGGGNIIAGGGGNIIAGGGMNFADRSLLALTNNAIVGSRVYLADQAGIRYPGLPDVGTDANGNFTIPEVPAGFNYVVVAMVVTSSGKEGTLQSLVHATAESRCSVTPGTTLVTSSLLDGTSRIIGDYDEATYQGAVDATNASVKADEEWPDFGDIVAVRAQAAALAKQVATLQAALDALRLSVTAPKSTLDDLNSVIGPAATAPTPTPTPSQTPVPTASPVATPTPKVKAMYRVTGHIIANGYPVWVRFVPTDGNGVEVGGFTDDRGNFKILVQVVDGAAVYDLHCNPTDKPSAFRIRVTINADNQVIPGVII